MLYRSLALFLFALPAIAQPAHFGVKAGIPLTDYFDTGRSGSLHGSSEYSAATRRYTLGASVECPLPRSFSLEVDFIYHRMGYVGLNNFFDSSSGRFTNSAIDVKGNSWDLPVLVSTASICLLTPSSQAAASCGQTGRCMAGARAPAVHESTAAVPLFLSIHPTPPTSASDSTPASPPPERSGAAVASASNPNSAGLTSHRT